MTETGRALALQNDQNPDELFLRLKEYVNFLLDDSFINSELMKDLVADNELVYSAIKSFILGKGKRLRAILFFLIYNAYTDNINWNNANSAMVSIELIHSFILIHDDVIDKSETRRSKPTLYSAFDDIIQSTTVESGSNFVSGRDLAIVAGDIMYALAIHRFNKVDLETKVFNNSLDILTKIALQTAHGEFKELLEVLKPLELVTEAKIFKIYEQKTAQYTFTAPMLLGAIFAGNKKDNEELKKIALLIGRAFQIKNDIIELEEFAGNSMNEPPKDLKEKKRTLVLLWAYKFSDDADKKIIDNFLVNGNPQMNDYIRIYDIISKRGIIGKAKRLIYKIKNESSDLIEKLNIDLKSKEALNFYFNYLI